VTAVPAAPLHRATSGAIGGAATPATGSIALSGAFFAAGIAYLAAGSIGLAWIAPQLAIGAYLSPHVAAVTHLFTLGWITTMIFGALYQLLPVALEAPVRWRRAASASWWAFVPGVALFASGVATGARPLLLAGACLVAIGIALVVANVAWSLAHTTRRDATAAGIALAFAFLIAALLLGLLLAHNLEAQRLGAARVRVLATHLHIALVGWVLTMIVGVSHRLLPMFLLAHGANTRWTSRALVLLGVGTPVLAIGLNTTPWVLWLGIAAVAAGFACFAVQAVSFHRTRVRKHIEVPLVFAGAGLAFLSIAAILGVTTALAGVSHRAIATAYVATAILGGFTLYIVGFSYKIIPLLVWTEAYRGSMGKSAVPLVAQMYSHRAAALQLGAATIGVASLALSVSLGSAAGVYAAAALFLAGTIVFVAQIGRVALHLVHRKDHD
jgi:hypothetical protein